MLVLLSSLNGETGYVLATRPDAQSLEMPYIRASAIEVAILYIIAVEYVPAFFQLDIHLLGQ